MVEELKKILSESELEGLFLHNRTDDNRDRDIPYVSYRVKSNKYRIRAFEIWRANKEESFFRIYHSNKINENLKNKFMGIGNLKKMTKKTIDYKNDDYLSLCKEIKSILLNRDIIKECEKNSSFARTSKFQGLDLPDVDVSQDDVFGQTFTWREIISIWEDGSEDNVLREKLKKNGIYLQRSLDGKSRYVGSAYGSAGIIGRWMKHLNSNGDAQHLNLFILENGYNEVVFSVLEFCNEDDILKRENKWKEVLGTVNYGPYNGIQLNNN